MTAIVGLVDQGRVLIGGDSAGSDGYALTVRRDAKVFATGPYLFGFTSSFRMGQLLQWRFNPPAPEEGELHRFMATTWIDAVRECLKAGGYAKREHEREEGGTFLVGIRGHLFFIHDDYQVGEALDGYYAVGCGAGVALGALYATAGQPPADRVRTALAAAERHCAGVRAPFTFVWETHRPADASA